MWDDLTTVDGNEPWNLSAEPRSLDQVLEEAASAIRSRQRDRDIRYVRRLTEVARFVEGVYSGIIPTSRFQEAMSTSDFPILFGDLMDRQLLGSYAETPNTWSQYLGRGTVRDFRTVKMFTMDGMEQPFYPNWPKAELETVKEDNFLTPTEYETSVNVYEKGFSFNWRMAINDDLDFLRLLPQKLARGARRTEQRFASGLYQTSAGPRATFFNNANRNLVNVANGATTNNPPLSIQGLKDAFNVFYRQTDADGDPIFLEGAILLVPPALQITAEEILSATNFAYAPGATAGQSFTTANWLGSRLRVAVDWYAPILNTTSGHTAWYLFANPSASRPAAQVTFLRGYEQPQLYRKAPNTERLGGGVDPSLGDFEDMSWRFKGMHIIGGTLIDPKMAVASDGTGS